MIWLVSNSVFAQEGGVSIGKGRLGAHEKAILELVSDSKGLLIPRMTSVERNAIFEVPDDSGKGLMVYDIDKKAFYYYDGVLWKEISGGDNKVNLGTELPLASSSVAGELFFNTSTSSLFIFDGIDWIVSSAKAENLVTSVAGKTGDIVLQKEDVGLGNVDNTSDADKPVSTATQAALDLKADIANVLQKNNTDEFIPSTDYQPATKKYVDDKVGVVDGSNTNEGSLSVLEGSSNTSVIRSNTAGSSDITIKAGENISLSESGNTIIIAASGTSIYKSVDKHAIIKSSGTGKVTAVQEGNNTTVTIPLGTILDYVKLSLDNSNNVYEGSYYVTFKFAESEGFFTGSNLADAESWLLPQIQVMAYIAANSTPLSAASPGNYAFDTNRPFPKFYEIVKGGFKVELTRVDNFQGPFAVTLNW